MTGKNSEELDNQAGQLRKWIETQSHLPKDLDDQLLKRFLHSCYYDVNTTKKAVETFFDVRGIMPEILNDRDPSSQHMQKIMKIITVAYIPISGNRVLWVWQVNDEGLENYDYTLDAKLFCLIADTWMLTNDTMEEEDLIILDVKCVTLKFITKFNLSVSRKMMKYQQDGVPIRLKQVHVVNTPSFVDKLHALMKPLMSQKLTNAIQFHTTNSDTIFKHISKEDLPEDFGGTNGKLEEYNRTMQKNIFENREKLTNDNLWRPIEKKLKNKAESATDVGTFRTLSID